MYYNDYNTYLRNTFHAKVYKISIDAGFTCPNIDGTVGTGGCIYCNNESFSPSYRQKLQTIEEQITQGIAVAKKYKATKYIAYFQPHTNTHASVDTLEKIYTRALQQHKDIVGIAIGTRPDAVDEEKIEMLENLAKRTYVSIEYGLQSISNATLQWIQRRHTVESYQKAMQFTINRNIHICTHIMFGFPNENNTEHVIQTAKLLNQYGTHGIKLHNLLIVHNTQLAKMFQENPFPLFSLDEYVSLVCDFLEYTSPNIICERLYATAPSEYLIAPLWRCSPAQIIQALEKKFEQRNTYQGAKYIS